MKNYMITFRSAEWHEGIVFAEDAEEAIAKAQAGQWLPGEEPEGTGNVDEDEDHEAFQVVREGISWVLGADARTQ